MARLLAVVGVEPDKRVRCRAEGCNRPVYRRIHVVEEDDGSIQVLGSSCFGLLYKGKRPGEAVYTGPHSRQLTEEERRMLDENTEQLIEAFKRERQFASEEPPIAEAAPDPRPSDIRAAPPEPGREVKCHFCGEMMKTLLPHTPALGFKCSACKEAGIDVPLAVRNRSGWRRR